MIDPVLQQTLMHLSNSSDPEKPPDDWRKAKRIGRESLPCNQDSW